MLHRTIIFVLLVQVSYASTYTLNSILELVSQNNTLSKALQKEGLELESINSSQTAIDPLELYVEGSRANPIIGKSGNEYTVGVSQNFKLGSLQEDEQTIVRLQNQAYLLEEEKNILDFTNTIKNMYHQYCINRQNYSSFVKSYEDFTKLYEKKQKAFNYQEISKIELMQLEIEKNSLHTKLKEIKMQEQVSKNRLFILSHLNTTKGSKLSCKDMYPIRANIEVDNIFQVSLEAHDKRIQSTQYALERYSNYLDSIDVSAQYTEELDMDKYTVGISIPLNFSSSRNEDKRAAAMYENSKISLKHEHMLREKKGLLLQLQSQLNNSAQALDSLTKNYTTYHENLLPLIQKSYDLGETSVIEYLLNRQKSYQLRQEIYSTKKTYYSLLFKLYTLIEKKDKK